MTKMRTAVKRQQGIVLVVALVMMAVIAVSSAVALRSAMSLDQVSASLRARGSALQAAEAALRYCEASITTTSLTAAQAAIPRLPANSADQAPAWTQRATWTGPSANVVVLPATFVFDGSNATYNRQPECLIQEVTLPPVTGWDPASPTPEAYVVTARGFSPDYAENNNTPVAGAVVWLQSTIQILR